ncbi:MAG: hypothetical protein ACXVDJ_00455 [Tumebacillaceae bacterium]
MMTPQHPNQNPKNGLHKSDPDSEYLTYEWSKGYLPTENPKPDEIDQTEERQK